MDGVYCIIVTFNPDIELLINVITSLHESVHLLIVKNSLELLPVEILRLKNVVILQLERNYGIAYAQNRGIEEALKLGAEWILLSDQDTVYPNNYIAHMLEIAKKNKLKNIGALVPVFYDEVKKQYAPIMIRKTRKTRPERGQIYKLAHSISSGTLIPVSVLLEVGFMKEELFIDFVDNEWFWRLEKYNLYTYCISDVIIHHQLGDKIEKRFGIKIVSRSLIRFYYIIRNGYFLLGYTDYLKGGERILFSLLIVKKILEALLLNGVSKKTINTILNAVKNGKENRLIDYERC